jgi:hypothetical protein
VVACCFKKCSNHSKNSSNMNFYFKMGRLEQLSGRPPVSRAGGRAFET